VAIYRQGIQTAQRSGDLQTAKEMGVFSKRLAGRSLDAKGRVLRVKTEKPPKRKVETEIVTRGSYLIPIMFSTLVVRNESVADNMSSGVE
jgi:hypothetical protein